MTALSEYERLEGSGLWRATPDAQRIEVIVSLGDATLVISDMADRALTHWSLPAVERANPGQMPALYHPDGDPGETLELAESETDMIGAIETLRTRIRQRRPHPGRLRLLGLLAMLVALLALGVFWLPDAVRRHAVRVVPDVKRAEIGSALLQEMQSVTGPPCGAAGGTAALDRLATRLPGERPSSQLLVMRDGVPGTLSLPGGKMLIARDLVEEYEQPDVLAGYVIAERLRAARADPLDRLLRHAGLGATVRLLTTGDPGAEALRGYAHHLLSAPPIALPDDVLLAGFRLWSVRATPYAYARDPSGETTLALIEADPFAGTLPEPVLSDSDWLRLQAICGG